MPRVYVEFAGVRQLGGSCGTVYNKIGEIQDEFKNTVRQLDWDIRFEENIQTTADQLTRKLDGYKKTLTSYQKFLETAVSRYMELDGTQKSLSTLNLNATPETKKSFADYFKDEFDWGKVLGGSNYIGTLYNLFQDIKSANGWEDWIHYGIDVGQFLQGVATQYKNYKRIGNAVGKKTATSWFLKNAIGWKPLGRASTAKNPITRFANNLKNSTSPFNLKKAFGDFVGENGTGKAVAAWAQVAVSGIFNWMSNKEEQAASGGTMSDGRVIAETITETAIDTILTRGASVVVGAAVTTIFGTAAAPAIVVTAVSSVAIMGINAGVKAATGKTVTEFVSDTILDAAEDIGSAVTKASDAVGKWFSKLSFA